MHTEITKLSTGIKLFLSEMGSCCIRTGGCSGGVWLGNVLESTSRHVESLTLPWDLLFVLCGKTSGFHPTLPATSPSVLRISLHSTNTTASG